MSSAQLNLFGGVRIADVPRVRPVFYPELGAFFTELRTNRAWTMRQTAALADRKGLNALTRQVLFRLEKGQIKNPEPDVLQAVAQLYDVPYPELVTRFVSRRYGIDLASNKNPSHFDLPWHADSVSSAPQREGASRGSDSVQTAHRPNPDALHAAVVLYTTGIELQQRAGEILRRFAPDPRSGAPAHVPVHPRSHRGSRKRTPRT